MKKGFTLIELLAVIVILAIIAVITMPMITRVIDKAKIGALEDSAYGLIEAANLYYTQHISEINTTTFVTDETKKGMYAEENKLPYKGFIPDSGSQITINEQGKISIRIISGDYCAIKSINETKITLLQKDCTTSIDGETTVDTNVTSEDIEILQNQIDTMNAQVITNTEDITNITNDLNGIKFGTDAEGNYGYYKEGETTINYFNNLKFNEGSLIGNTTSKQIVTCGFKPKYIFVSNYGDVSSNGNSIHYEYKDGSQMYQYYTNARYTSFTGFFITDTGFEFTGYNASLNPLHYYAIGY
ncbi:MAG: prepilin-type N-terminal cleavage/methylation domain-containing protein [Bacilli bacterium]|nr:prepilin-type N-terminal cleavage/methylation domain-containing protein [Bacilli bacterium]